MSNNVEESKIISKIDKIFKQIDPNSKKQITELSENVEFRKSVETIKEFLQEYIGNPGFPKEVYDRAKELIAFCDEQYKNLADKKEQLQLQAQNNVELSKVLNEVYLFAVTRENFDAYIPTLNENGLADYVVKLETILKEDRKSPDYIAAEKTIKSKINNLETNMHIDIDLERITDKEKALSYISIELENVLAKLSNRAEPTIVVEAEDPVIPTNLVENYVPDYNVYGEYVDDSLILVKTDVWTKFVNSKFVAKVKELFKGNEVKALNPGTVTVKAE